MPEGPAAKYLRGLIKRFPKAPALTLAKIAFRDHPEYWANVEACRSMIRRILGARGEVDRARIVDKSLYRPPRQPGDWLKRIPKAITQLKNWAPVRLFGANRTLILSDVHVPFHDPQALQLALEYGVKHKATLILLNGDIVDHYWGSTFVTDPRLKDFAAEIKAAKKLLRGIRKTFLKAKIVWKYGNHEERYDRYMQLKCPEFLGVEQFEWGNVFGLADLGVELVREKRPIQLGKLNVIHGHEYKFQIANPVNPARGFFLRAKCHVLGGHFHQSSAHSEKNIEGKVISTWSTGCLCDLHPEYLPINSWGQGFAFVETDADGSFHVDNRRIIEGKVW